MTENSTALVPALADGYRIGREPCHGRQPRFRQWVTRIGYPA